MQACQSPITVYGKACILPESSRRGEGCSQPMHPPTSQRHNLAITCSCLCPGLDTGLHSLRWASRARGRQGPGTGAPQHGVS